MILPVARREGGSEGTGGVDGAVVDGDGDEVSNTDGAADNDGLRNSDETANRVTFGKETRKGGGLGKV